MRLNSIEEILTLPNTVQNCTVLRHDLLKYVYDNRYDEGCTLNVDKLNKILLKSIANSYKKREYDDEIVIKKTDIDQLIKRTI